MRSADIPVGLTRAVKAEARKNSEVRSSAESHSAVSQNGILPGATNKLTRGFPAEERFGLTNQMRRAAVSISSNLAEGGSRSSSQDYARFGEMTTGSVFAVVSQATIGRNQGFMTEVE